MKKSGIYIITNKVNGKVYIGSSVDLNVRWSEHRWEFKNHRHDNKYFQNAVNKYGLENFEFKVIELVEPIKEKLIEREQYYLDFYKSYDPNVGYNILKKAYSALGMVPSEETRKLWRLQRKGRPAWNKDIFKVSQICILCGQKFRQPKWQMINRKFCSRDCSFKYRSLHKKPGKSLFVKGSVEWKNWVKQQVKNGIQKAGGSPKGMLGKKHSTKTKYKMRLAHLGYKQTQEHIKNVINSRRGLRWSVAQRERHKFIQKRRFQKYGVSKITRRKLSDASKKSWQKRKLNK